MRKARAPYSGFTESACGLASVIINFIALGLYAKVAVGSHGRRGRIKGGYHKLRAVGLIATIALVFLLPDPEKAGKGQDGGDSGQEAKLSMKEWAGVFKDPRTWFAGIAVFATYSTYQTLSYFTPYFTNVLGGNRGGIRGHRHHQDVWNPYCGSASGRIYGGPYSFRVIGHSHCSGLRRRHHPDFHVHARRGAVSPSDCYDIGDWFYGTYCKRRHVCGAV